MVQDGNDFWNAAFFCGSCAVLRRTALDEIGGIAVETVTEDAHTSLRMQTQRLEHGVHQHSAGGGPGDGATVGARGAADPLGARDDPDTAHRNPLFAPGLKFPQRLCYFNAMCALPLCGAAADFSHLAADLPAARSPTSSGYWVAILRLRVPAPHRCRA